MIPLPPAVAPRGVVGHTQQALEWFLDTEPGNWPPGSYVDCSYCTNGHAARAALQAGYGVLAHNYGPRWCDVFVSDCQPDRSWLPLEDIGGSTTAGDRCPCSSLGPIGVASTPASHKPHPLVAAAYSARTLQQRLDGAKAALREGGAAAATDARLLLTDSLPLPHAAKVKSCISIANAAVAAAEQEAAAAPPRHGGASAGAGTTALTACQRAALRAVVAMLGLRAQQAPDDDVEEASASCVYAAWTRFRPWLGTVDPHKLVAGADSGYVAALVLWCSDRNPSFGGVDRRHIPGLLKSCIAQCEETALGFTTCTMGVHYNLYFVAYAAKGQPGGGPTGALVRQALAAIKRVDPDAWVVRLMLGLELADGVVRPSFMLGSKQEAMACCSMLACYWMSLPGQAFSAALEHLFEPCIVMPACTWAFKAAALSEELAGLVIQFNTGQLRAEDGCLADNPVILEAVKQDYGERSDVAQRLVAMPRGLLAHMLVLTALERATVNLPPIHSHWPYWQGSPVLKLLGTSSAADTASVLRSQVTFHHDRATSLIKCLMKLRSEDCAQGQQTQQQLTEALHSAACIKARCFWQAGQVAQALQQLQPLVPANLVDAQDLHLASICQFFEEQTVLDSQPSCSEPMAEAADNRQTVADPQHVPCHQRQQQQQQQQLCPSTHGTPIAGAADASLDAAAACSCPQQSPDPHVQEASSSGACSGACSPASSVAALSAAEAADGAAVLPPESSQACSSLQQQKACAQCGMSCAALKRCAGCREVRYCGSACQRLHWRAGHQAACSRRLLKDAGVACEQSKNFQ